LNLEVDVAQDVKKLFLRQRIETLEVFEFDHDESAVVTRRDHWLGATGAQRGM
jgi:hypothetical protein